MSSSTVRDLIPHKNYIMYNKGMESLLVNFSLISDPLAYSLIFLGILIEGDAMLFIASFLAFQGFFLPGYVIGIAVVAVLLRDSLLRGIGKKMAKSHHWIDRWSEGIAAPFEPHLTARPTHSLLVAKFVYGLHLAIILRIGALKISDKKFYTAEAVAIPVWITAICTLGYISAISFFAARSYLRFVEIGLLVALVAYGLLHHYLSRYSKRSLRR